MARTGTNPPDMRSESETIRQRPHRQSPALDESYQLSKRASEKVPTQIGMGERDRDKGVSPDQPKGKRESLDPLAATVDPQAGGDGTLRLAVVKQLAMDPALEASDITVSAREGVITLEGLVDTKNTKFYAEKLAARVAGVIAVENRLGMRLGEAIEEHTRGSDAARLREQLARDHKFK